MFGSMYCPNCRAPVVELDPVVVVDSVFGAYTARRATVAVCTRCALVSEVNGRGNLIDLGHIHRDDLESPFTPWKLPLCIQDPTPVLHRRDS